MIYFLAIVYGLHFALLVYFVAYIAARGILGKGAAPVYIVVAKYLIYWCVISFGFKYLPAGGILLGFTAGLYLSLPVLYWVNKRLTRG